VPVRHCGTGPLQELRGEGRGEEAGWQGVRQGDTRRDDMGGEGNDDAGTPETGAPTRLQYRVDEYVDVHVGNLDEHALLRVPQTRRPRDVLGDIQR
jgi:hypothetical protein